MPSQGENSNFLNMKEDAVQTQFGKHTMLTKLSQLQSTGEAFGSDIDSCRKMTSPPKDDKVVVYDAKNPKPYDMFW